jgi:hypothetical protein
VSREKGADPSCSSAGYSPCLIQINDSDVARALLIRTERNRANGVRAQPCSSRVFSPCTLTKEV